MFTNICIYSYIYNWVKYELTGNWHELYKSNSISARSYIIKDLQKYILTLSTNYYKNENQKLSFDVYFGNCVGHPCEVST